MALLLHALHLALASLASITQPSLPSRVLCNVDLIYRSAELLKPEDANRVPGLIRGMASDSQDRASFSDGYSCTADCGTFQNREDCSGCLNDVADVFGYKCGNREFCMLAFDLRGQTVHPFEPAVPQEGTITCTNVR